MNLPTATYRIQLRNGVDFATVETWLPTLDDLGISHLYLSPVQTASDGSGHGYDITDPTEVDPVLGGRSGLERLSRAAAARGMGVIIDIVPNHTAFGFENRWLRDVLRHGRNSRHAPAFEIDWNAGPLVLPFLTDEYPALVERGEIAIGEGADGPVLEIGGIAVPLDPETVPAEGQTPDWAALHEAQHWRLTPWRHERDGVTHRRFFNVTSLIGMRVEDPPIFDATHELILDLVASGVVQGLRVDHVDGLVDPAGYLRRLRAAVGPDCPIWVEKILAHDERLPDWPVEGTTGYEAARALVRVLTDPSGLEVIRDAWMRDAEGPDWEECLQAAKSQIMRQDLAAELHQLIALGRAAAEAEERVAGDEVLRETVLILLQEVPRYRTYFTEDDDRAEDRELLQEAVERARPQLFDDRLLDAMAGWITEAATPPARLFRIRFQQITGALLAKAQEDTAGFRWTSYLAANEVGSEPDAATMSVPEFSAWMRAYPRAALTLGSTHDTKRAEDARMRLVAASHLPDRLVSLVEAAASRPSAAEVPADLRWYVVQTLLSMWEDGREDLGDRLAEHMVIAMRQAKQITLWTRVDDGAEAAVQAFAADILEMWRESLPDAAAEITHLAGRFVLAQVGLRLTMPGIPDIYQGAESTTFLLGDPDNRREVDPVALAQGGGTSLAEAKRDLTRTLLRLRRERPDLFAEGEVEAAGSGAAELCLTRRRGRDAVTVILGGGAEGDGAEVLWSGQDDWPMRVTLVRG